MILTCVFCNVTLNRAAFSEVYSCNCNKFRLCTSSFNAFKNGCYNFSWFNIYDNLFLIYIPYLNATNKVLYTFDGYEYNSVLNGQLDFNCLKYKEGIGITNFGPISIIDLFANEIKSIEDKIKKNLIFL